MPTKTYKSGRAKMTDLDLDSKSDLITSLPKSWNPMDFKSHYTEMMVYATTYFNCWKVTLPNENQWKEHYLNRYYRPWVNQYNVLESSVHDQ